jgi:hypothetical protein
LPALLLLTHCKTESEGTGAKSDRDAFIAQYCELAAPCCSGSSNGCTNAIGKAVPANFDPASGKACLDAIRLNSTDEHFCSKGLFLSDVEACRRLSTRGTLAVGEACNDAVTGAECAPSPDGPVACVFGQGKQICQLQALGSDGASCVADSDDDGSLPPGVSLDVAVSEKGTYCNRADGLHCVDGKCGKLAAVGASCTDFEGCAVGAYCSYAEKLCKALVADGAPCTGDDSCASNHCDSRSGQCSSASAPVFLDLLCGG